MPEERIVVMMPFGSNRELRIVRRSMLEYLRIKHIIQRSESPSDRNLTLSIKVVNIQNGNIPSEAISEILQADTTICLLTEHNLNVVFELAIRCLRDVPILIVEEELRHQLPIYLAGQAIIRYEIPEKVLQTIDRLAEETDQELNWETAVPSELAQSVDLHDRELLSKLRQARHDHDRLRGRRSPIREQMLRYSTDEAIASVVKRGLYKRWETYYPCSTVEVQWKSRSDVSRYSENDINGAARVIDFNNRFSDLYDFEANVCDQSSLTLGFLLDRIRPYLEDPAAFEKDQDRLTRRIVFEQGYAQTRVAMRISEDHPIEAMRGRSFLPCLVGKDLHLHALNPALPHRIYLIILYADVTSLTGRRRYRRKETRNVSAG